VQLCDGLAYEIGEGCCWGGSEGFGGCGGGSGDWVGPPAFAKVTMVKW